MNLKKIPLKILSAEKFSLVDTKGDFLIIVMEIPTGKWTHSKHSKETIAQALEEVKSGDLSLWKAAKKYDINFNTLKNRLNGEHDGKVGAKTVLTAKEEEGLVAWVQENALLAQPLPQKQFCDAVHKAALKYSPDDLRFSKNGMLMACEVRILLILQFAGS